MKMFSNEYHCDLCRCPIEVWKPYRDYPSDRSCEVFYFLEDLLAREKGAEFTVDEFVKKYRREVKQEFQDLKNFEGVFKEHLEWQTDIADVKEVSPGVYIAPLWPERKEI